MSYVIHIWDHYPLPSNDEEAAQIFERLSSETTLQNPKFIELAERLKAHFPSTPVTSDEDDVLVDFDDTAEYEVDWPEGPPDGLTNDAVYALQMGGDMDIVFPVLANTAGALDLTVYDSQNGKAYLPGGKVLIPGGGNLSQEDDSSDVPEGFHSRSQVKKLLARELKPFLGPYGFKKVKGMTKFVKRHKDTDVEIDLPVYGMSRVKMSCRLNVKFDQEICEATGITNSRWRSYRFDLNRVAERAGLPVLGESATRYDSTREIEFDNPFHLKAMVKIMGEFLSRAFMPVMAECASFKGLDKHLNRTSLEKNVFEIDKKYPFAFTELMIMYMAKNPDFDGQAIKLLEELPPGQARDWLAAALQRSA